MTQGNPLHDNTALSDFIQNGAVYGLFSVVSGGGLDSTANMSPMPFPISKPFWDALGYVPATAIVKFIAAQSYISLSLNLADNAPEGLIFTGSLIVFNLDFSEVIRKRWQVGPIYKDNFYTKGVEYIGDTGSVTTDLYVGDGDTGSPTPSQSIFSTAGGTYFVNARLDTIEGWKED